MLKMHMVRKELLVSDLDLSMDYYSTVLGIQKEGSTSFDTKNGFSLTLKQAQHLSDVHPKKLCPETYGFVDTVEELYSLYLRCRENGALFAFNPRDTYENGNRVKEFAIRDIDGYIIAFKVMTNIENTIVEERPLVY